MPLACIKHQNGGNKAWGEKGSRWSDWEKRNNERKVYAFLGCDDNWTDDVPPGPGLVHDFHFPDTDATLQNLQRQDMSGWWPVYLKQQISKPA